MFFVLGTVGCGTNQEGQCHGENLFGVLLIVFLAVAVAVGIMGWIWVRWERGPFWIVMRFLTITREKRKPRN